MAISSDLYLEQIQKLLPSGAAWPRDPEANLTKILWALAASLSRVDSRADDLLDESDPRSTTEMLGDWEAMAGLPDPCSGIPDTLQDRHFALHGRITNRGGQTPEFFVNLAAGLGFNIIIVEYRYFRASVNHAGDRLGGDEAAYTWKILAGITSVTLFRAGISTTGESLGTLTRNNVLECAIARSKPAHTLAIFDYTGVVPVTEIQLAPLTVVSAATHPVKASLAMNLNGMSISTAASLPAISGVSKTLSPTSVVALIDLRVRGTMIKTLSGISSVITGTVPLIPFDLDDGDATFVADVYLDGGTAASPNEYDIDGGNVDN